MAGGGSPRAAASVWLAGYQAARTRFPPRPAGADWPATTQARGQVLEQLAGAVADQRRAGGIESRLDWLEDREGDSWQRRWLASGADAAGPGGWRCPASG